MIDELIKSAIMSQFASSVTIADSSLSVYYSRLLEIFVEVLGRAND